MTKELPSREQMVMEYLATDPKLRTGEALIDLFARRDEMVIELIAAHILHIDCPNKHDENDGDCHARDAESIRALKDKLK